MHDGVASGTMVQIDSTGSSTRYYFRLKLTSKLLVRENTVENVLSTYLLIVKYYQKYCRALMFEKHEFRVISSSSESV